MFVRFDSIQMTTNNEVDEIDEILSPTSFFPDSISLSPAKTIALNTLSPEFSSKKETSKKALQLAKHRDRMRKRRKLEKAEMALLNAQVKVLTEQLQQLLKIRDYNHTQKALTNSLSLSQESRRESLMRSYVQLILMSEQLQKENKAYEQKLFKEWGRYVNFVSYQLQQFYGPTSIPQSSSSIKRRAEDILRNQPMHPDKMSPKQYRSYGDGNWVPFVLNRLRNQKDKSILLFRESTDDVYFRPISESMCKKLQSEAYDEGMSFTEAIQLELQNTSLPIAKEMKYFGWKMIYYPISTQKAYPHLTQVTVLDTHGGKDAVDDMIRFDYVKRYVAGSYEDINSIFAQFRKRCLGNADS